MSNPERSERLHTFWGHFWVINLITVVGLYFFANPLWQKISVLYLVLISLHNNATSDYGAANSAKAARISEDTWFKKLMRWLKIER